MRIHEALEARGLKPIAATARFYIEALEGPLEEGEEGRGFRPGPETGKLLMTPAD